MRLFAFSSQESIFNSEAAEHAFASEFRGPGLRWTAYAAAAGALLFGLFFVIGITLESHSALGLSIRAGLCGFLALVAVLLWLRSPIGKRVAITPCRNAADVISVLR
ncbi:MAG: hypothetical protein RIS35_1378 [Pseudomonadota bacterium]|jgi:hypothetical protein